MVFNAIILAFWLGLGFMIMLTVTVIVEFFTEKKDIDDDYTL